MANGRLPLCSRGCGLVASFLDGFDGYVCRPTGCKPPGPPVSVKLPPSPKERRAAWLQVRPVGGA